MGSARSYVSVQRGWWGAGGGVGSWGVAVAVVVGAVGLRGVFGARRIRA